MNYPIWDLPAPGLLIAFVAIVHVFISHFAVGGGLFLVLTERKARREGDEALLAFIREGQRCGMIRPGIRRLFHLPARGRGAPRAARD